MHHPVNLSKSAEKWIVWNLSEGNFSQLFHWNYAKYNPLLLPLNALIVFKPRRPRLDLTISSRTTTLPWWRSAWWISTTIRRPFTGRTDHRATLRWPCTSIRLQGRSCEALRSPSMTQIRWISFNLTCISSSHLPDVSPFFLFTKLC